jgi:GNAT superfamily N-acetyltransferase
VGGVEIRRLSPDDDAMVAEWHGVMHAVEQDLWPGIAGYSLRDIQAFVRHRGRFRRYLGLAAGEPGGPILGVGTMELALRDNLHSVEVMVGVHPAHRRRGVGTAIVEEMSRQASADGRQVLNSIVEVPLDRAEGHPSVHFARHLGFEEMLPGNVRHLAVPVDPALLDKLREVVATARDASDYRTFTFEAPWPEQYLEDECELLRRMSTDEPSGDADREEEVWSLERLREQDELRQGRGLRKLAAVTQHRPSGRLVAFSELMLAEDAPHQAWQMITIVHPAHRGHRLGLAVKLANLDFLAERAPDVRTIRTSNAQENAPMIAVNDLFGFEIVGVGMFWQKQL